MTWLIDIKKRLYILLFLFMSGCGGSETPAQNNPPGNSGISMDKSGVWIGDIGKGSGTFIVDDNNDVYGLSVFSGSGTTEYYSFFGNLGQYSEDTTDLRINEHERDILGGSTHNPFSQRAEVITYRNAFIERQTAEVQIAGQSNIYTLTYALAYESNNGSLVGSWFSRHIYLGGNQNNLPLYNAYELAISIDSAGNITGTEADNIGWNWTHPTGPSIRNVSGNLTDNAISGLAIKSANIAFTNPSNPNNVSSYNGYSYISTSGANQFLSIITVNQGSNAPYVMKLTKQ